MKLKQKKAGFTLIEMIVSLGLFSVVVTIAVGSLLVLIASNRQLQDEQSILSNLTFAVDGMTREIRTGRYYDCESRNSVGGSFSSSNDLDSAVAGNDCSSGNNLNRRFQGISFVEGGDSVTGGNERILYFFNRNQGKLYRRIGTQVAQPITSDGIYIRSAEFFVSGSRPLSSAASQDDQAAVTLIIEAAESNDPSAKVHVLQTTITQREIDI